MDPTNLKREFSYKITFGGSGCNISPKNVIAMLDTAYEESFYR